MPDLYRVRVTLGGWLGAPGLATHYFLEDGSPADTAIERAQDCADRVRAGWVPIAAKQPGIWTCDVQSTVDVLNADTGALIASHSVTAPASLGGTEGTKFGPAAAGLCVNWLTGAFIAGRRLRGRTFISPVNDGVDANGTPTAPHVAAALAMYPILSEHDTGFPLFAVWHRPVSGAGGAAHPVTGTTCRDVYSVLTSRR